MTLTNIHNQIHLDKDPTMTDYRDLCRVHIESQLTEEFRELKHGDISEYYDSIFGLALDHSLLMGATLEEALWCASLVCCEY